MTLIQNECCNKTRQAFFISDVILGQSKNLDASLECFDAVSLDPASGVSKYHVNISFFKALAQERPIEERKVFLQGEFLRCTDALRYINCHKNSIISNMKDVHEMLDFLLAEDVDIDLSWAFLNTVPPRNEFEKLSEELKPLYEQAKKSGEDISKNISPEMAEKMQEFLRLQTQMQQTEKLQSKLLAHFLETKKRKIEESKATDKNSDDEFELFKKGKIQDGSVFLSMYI